MTSLQNKFFSACRSKSVSAVQNLISSGQIDINATDESGLTALHMAINRGKNSLTRFLLENKADIQATNPQGETPLFLAIDTIRPELVNILLSHKAALTNLNRHRQSALWLILHRKRREDRAREEDEELRRKINIDKILNLILDHGMSSEFQEIFYKFCSLIIKNDLEAVKKLINRVSDVDFGSSGAETPLEFAVLLNRPQIANTLLDRGASPDQESLLFSTLDNNSSEMMKLLLKFQANVDFVYNLNQRTPLFHATQLKNVNLMRQILDSGASVNATSLGSTALHRSCFNNFLDGVKLLLEYSADVNVPDDDGNTALHLSIKSAEIVEFLVERGAVVDAENHEQRTPLHFACKDGDLRTIKFLIEQGAKSTAIDSRGRTVLHDAVNNHDFEAFLYVADSLISSGIININTKDANGQTPLHSTGDSVHDCQIFIELLKRGGDPNIRSSGGKCPEHKHGFDLDPVKCPVVEYVQRLRMINLRVNMDNYYEQGEVPEEKVSKELDRLREKVIVRGKVAKTLFDVFFMGRNLLSRCSANEDVEQVFGKCKKGFEENYPFFGGLLNTQFYRGLNRREWMKTAKGCLECVLGQPVPDICGDFVLRYLTDTELQSFRENEI